MTKKQIHEQSLNETIELTHSLLIVEEDVQLCELCVKALRESGFAAILTADSAEAAMELLGLSDQNDSYNETLSTLDLIIVENLLPGMSGVQLCKKIKHVLPALPVILVSDCDVHNMHIKILDSKADDFMLKSFNMIELVTRVNCLMARSKTMEHTFLHQGYHKIQRVATVPYIGDKVDSYLIVDSLGLGKVSLIFKVLDTRNNEFYAMKILSGASNDFDKAIKRFEYEIDIMHQINHPNIIAFQDRGYYCGVPYLVMEYLNGIDLEELLISRGRLPEKVVFSIAFDLACALNEIYDKGIIHRDIKLQNSIYIPATSQVKLCDFGIAQLNNPIAFTQDGLILGTPIYMAPEIFRGESANLASDVYSYGATIYHLATNTPPFVAENYTELFEQHSFDAPPAIESIRTDFSPLWTELIVNMCLAKDPYKRPKLMTDVMSLLLEIKKNIPRH